MTSWVLMATSQIFMRELVEAEPERIGQRAQRHLDQVADQLDGRGDLLDDPLDQRDEDVADVLDRVVAVDAGEVRRLEAGW